MIVRVLGEGQLEVPQAEVEGLQALDNALQAALDSDDDDAFRTALGALLERVRAVGKPIPDDEIKPSGLILPAGDAHVDDVRAMLTDEGLIPG
jgi:hypothetical protein